MSFPKIHPAAGHLARQNRTLDFECSDDGNRAAEWGGAGLDRGLRVLIRRIHLETRRGALHGELLMLGFDVAQATVSKYMARKGLTAVADLEGISSQSRRCSPRLTICAGPRP